MAKYNYLFATSDLPSPKGEISFCLEFIKSKLNVILIYEIKKSKKWRACELE
jgi:hypothetical protein